MDDLHPRDEAFHHHATLMNRVFFFLNPKWPNLWLVKVLIIHPRIQKV